MRITGKPCRRILLSVIICLLLSVSTMPSMAFAGGGFASEPETSSELADAEETSLAEAPYAGAEVEEGVVDTAANLASPLAAALIGKPVSFVSADVALGNEADPVVGSFTVGGMTFSLSDDGATLVAVAPGAFGADGPDGGRGEVGTSEPSAPSGPSEIPSTVVYGGIGYNVVAIGPYSFYLSGVTEVALPASIASVDERAFRSSDVERVEVDPANPNIASFDGALYSADLSSLLLIPEGRAGTVLLPCEAEVADPSKFSHCSLVDAIDAEEGGAAFASWDGLLYDATGTTLLRVPAGATDITIREGCTTIAAGAMEGCARLETINAPSTVTSISPDVFSNVPTVSLPAASLAEAGDDVAPNGVEEGEGALGSEVPTSPRPPSPSSTAADAPQLTAMVALSRTDGSAPEVDPSSVKVSVPDEVSEACWNSIGFSVVLVEEPDDSAGAQPVADAIVESSSTMRATPLGIVSFNANGGSFLCVGSSDLWGGATSVTSVYEYYYGNLAFTGGSLVFAWFDANGRYKGVTPSRPGYTCTGWTGTHNLPLSSFPNSSYVGNYSGNVTEAPQWRANPYTIAFDTQGGEAIASIPATYDANATLPAPADREHYAFRGWDTKADGTGIRYQAGTVKNLTTTNGATVILYAQWERVEYDVSFDTDSEPGDEDLSGEGKPDETVNKNDGAVEIENPTRPGYVFQGWVIPNTNGTEAVDQELVYEGDDGKWYVDASKLPDYATDGKVELTARWTSVISVDVPNSVTFYADTVTQGSESRDGLADRAFGQSKVRSQSQVDLRIVGLESQEVKGDGSAALGASDVLVSKGASTPADSAWKLFSLYPSVDELAPEDLQDPDRVSEAPEGGVTFGLDDVLLEKSFSTDGFTIPAGDTLSLGYRLNLEETGTSLDYGKLSQLPEGGTVALANISYCFAADAVPSDWGEPLWVENPDQSADPAKYLLLADIKEAAEDLSACEAAGDVTASEHYALYKGLLDSGADFHLKVGSGYLLAQLIGICQDRKASGDGPAGLTFSLKEPWALGPMNPTDTGAGGWAASQLRSRLQGTGAYAGTGFADEVDPRLRASVVVVSKAQQLGFSEGKGLQATSDTFFVPSVYEVCGTGSNAVWNVAETSASCFQYQWYAQWGATYESVPERAKAFAGAPVYWWLRSACAANDRGFGGISVTGSYAFMGGIADIGVVPCFCL